MGAECRPDAALDITGETCPMTFVRTRIALDRLAPGAVLAVRLRGAEPCRSVPLASEALGHTILGATTDADGVTTLRIRKRDGAAAS